MFLADEDDDDEIVANSNERENPHREDSPVRTYKKPSTFTLLYFRCGEFRTMSLPIPHIGLFSVMYVLPASDLISLIFDTSTVSCKLP